MGFGTIQELTVVCAALAVIISAMVSMIGTSARRQAVREGRARMGDLCELTGVFEPRALQDMFGPPTMEGFWPSLTLERVDRARKPLAWLLSDDRTDMVSIAVAILAFFVDHWLMNLALTLAVMVQAAGWVVSTRLPRQYRER